MYVVYTFLSFGINEPFLNIQYPPSSLANDVIVHEQNVTLYRSIQAQLTYIFQLGMSILFVRLSRHLQFQLLKSPVVTGRFVIDKKHLQYITADCGIRTVT